MEYISGHAVFTPEGNVKVGENIYTAKHILIACGGRPLIPNMPGESQKSCHLSGTTVGLNCFIVIGNRTETKVFFFFTVTLVAN